MEFEQYIENIFRKIEQSTEYTLRTDFENLLNSLKSRKTIEIIQENKKKESQSFGKPDFMVSENNLEIGWIETKPISDDLLTYIDSPQLKRYLTIIPNLLFTNYRDFILFRNGEELMKSTLFDSGDKNLKTSNVEKTLLLINEFFDAKYELIEKTDKLSILLARHTKYLHGELLELWNSKDNSQFKEKLTGLYELFSKTLIEDLLPNDFIDAYSQTVSYGLLMSALSADKRIDKYNFIEYIPKSLAIFDEIFGLLRLSNIPDGISWVIDKLLIILNNTDYSQVQKELSFAFQKGRNIEDPYIYFYENFLKAYNSEKRVEKGVFYTPSAVVSFIVKIIQQSLIKDFNKSGLDDDNISLLDFATGTGTFLLESYKVALENVDKGQKSGFIRNNLLQHFFGFEYLIAPYSIAHLKLTKFLTEEGFRFENDERVGVYLTDTLDDAVYQRNPLFPYISDESENATKIKLEKKVWIILGNPPYSNYSKNKKQFIQTLINDYKIGLSEAKINIDDDYIKFIRFAQAKIEGANYSYTKGNNEFSGKIDGTGQGIVGIITNNSYLSGITHRRMRKSLFDTFDKIYIVNLHGNSIIGEADKNVFDIMVGVAIVLFIKTPKPLKEKEIYYYSTLDSNMIKRDDKFNFLYDNDLDSIDWKRLKPEAPYYWFIEKDFSHYEQYEKGWRITDIFKVYNSGIKTDRDKLFIDKEKVVLEKRIKALFSEKLNDKFIKAYNVKDSGSYKLLNKIKNRQFDETNIHKLHYRPFDFRYIYYQVGLTSRPSFAVHQNIINKENIGIIFPRFAKGLKSNYGLVTNFAVDVAIGGRHSGSETYIAPLYIYNSNGNADENGNGYLFKDEEKKDNFTKEFRIFLKDNNLNDYSPEQILAYIYAILYSPTYRVKYFEFFKIDFPKIPFTPDIKLFEKLSELGAELIENHLLKRNYLKNDMPTFAVDGNNKVSDILFDEKQMRLYINKEQYFENFNKDIWQFEIGGYQVIDKYLKSRKDLELTYSDINHIKKVATTIAKTIEIQRIIDEYCATWI